MTLHLLTLATTDHGNIPVCGEPVGSLLAVTPAITCDHTDQPCLTGQWAVTHVPTGTAIGATTGCCLVHARQTAAYLDRCGVAWGRAREAIRSDPDARAAHDHARAIAASCRTTCQPQPCAGSSR